MYPWASSCSVIEATTQKTQAPRSTGLCWYQSVTHQFIGRQPNSPARPECKNEQGPRGVRSPMINNVGCSGRGLGRGGAAGLDRHLHQLVEELGVFDGDLA